MKIFIFLCLIGTVIFPEIYSAISFGLTVTIGLQLFLKSNESFMFREWALFLYASNYLLSPAITYQLNFDQITYAMKIPLDEYFSLALPGFILFTCGMYIIPNRLFKPDFTKINQAALINERFLIRTTII
jgi:hypothetical protein